LSHLDSCHLGE